MTLSTVETILTTCNLLTTRRLSLSGSSSCSPSGADLTLSSSPAQAADFVLTGLVSFILGSPSSRAATSMSDATSLTVCAAS